MRLVDWSLDPATVNPDIEGFESSGVGFLPRRLAGETREAVLDSLRRVFASCQTPDWDGYGAEAISRKTLEAATAILHKLPPGIPDPEISPEPEGDLAFGWSGHEGRYFSFAIDQEGTLTYSGSFEDGEAYGSETASDGELPFDIVTLIDRALRR